MLVSGFPITFDDTNVASIDDRPGNPSEVELGERSLLDRINDRVPTKTLFFTENVGQLGDAAGLYYATGGDVSIAFKPGQIDYYLNTGSPSTKKVTVTFRGSNSANPLGVRPLEQVSNFYSGSDPDGWRVGVKSYQEILYPGLYENIDLRFFFRKENIKYQFEVAPGGATERIQMVFSGARGLAIDPGTGDILIETEAGTLRDTAPVSYQRVDGETTIVTSAFEVLDDDVVGFELVGRVPELPLVIDPGLVFSTYLGRRSDEYCTDIEVNSEGEVFVIGRTKSLDFPTTLYAIRDRYQYEEVYLCKFDPNGTKLVYSTFIGGWRRDYGEGLALDGEGNAYVVGGTESDDFPTTSGAYKDTWYTTGSTTGFCVKIDCTNGVLLYGTYIGGTVYDYAMDVEVDDAGCAFIAGLTSSSDFGTTPGAVDDTAVGGEGFVLKLDANGSKAEYMTFLGGSGWDEINDMALDARGCAYVTGVTRSNDFPTVATSYNQTYNRYDDAFVSKLDPNGTALEYSTYLPGARDDRSFGIAVDGSGCAYVTGGSNSGDFPTDPWPPESADLSGYNAFILKLTNTGEDLVYSMRVIFLREGIDIALDDDGGAWVFAATGARDLIDYFPTSDDAFQVERPGYYDTAFFRVDPDGTSLTYASFLGGGHQDEAGALCLTDGYVFLGGRTRSLDFPTSKGAYSTKYVGDGYSATYQTFVVKVDISYPEFAQSMSPSNATTGDRYVVEESLVDNRNVSVVAIEHWFEDSPTVTTSNLTMTNGTSRNGTWSTGIDVPMHSLAPLHYVLWAEDSSDNTFTLEERIIPVLDDDAPVLTYDAPGRADVGDRIAFKVDVNDNIRVNDVRVVYRAGQNGTAVNESMWEVDPTNSTNGTYVHDGLVLSMASALPIFFQLYAEDPHGNWVMTEELRIDVFDPEDPQLIEDLSDSVATTGDGYRFKIRVWDNIAIDRMELVYWFGQHPLEEDIYPMKANAISSRGIGIYTYDALVIPGNSTESLFYYFRAYDQGGNSNRTFAREVQVTDNDRPVLVSDLSDTNVSTGDGFRFIVDVDDNILVDYVAVNHWFGNGSRVTLQLLPRDVGERGEGEYSNEVTVPEGTTLALFYSFTIMDLEGNKAIIATRSVLVEDRSAPTIGPDLSDPHAVRGQEFSYRAMSADASGPVTMEVTYALGGEAPVTLPMPFEDNSFHASVPIPRDAQGMLIYSFTSTDDSGNRAFGEEISIPLGNGVPVVHCPEIWIVPVGVEERLDMTPFIYDANDPLDTLTVEVDGDRVSVDGLVLIAMYSEVVGDHLVGVTVTDGESSAYVNITIHTVLANHRPDISVVSPEMDAVFKVGKVITFHAVAHDPELEEGQVLTIVWSSNMSGEIARSTDADGGPFEVSDLSPGRHTITVTVTDGEMSSSVDILITVLKKGETGPGEPDGGGDVSLWTSTLGILVLIMILVAVVVICVVIILKLRTRPGGDDR